MQTASDIRDRLGSVSSINAATVRKPAGEWESEASGRAPDPGCASDESFLAAVSAPRLFGLVELILKDRPRLESLLRDPALAGELIPRFMAISLTGFTFFGVALACLLALEGVEIHLMPIPDALRGDAPELMSFDAGASLADIGIRRACISGMRLIAAYDLGLVAAAGICLPSLYFYGLLAGVPMSMARVTAHTLKGMATTATALVGILPIYLAFGLGAAVFSAPSGLVNSTLQIGLILPFLAGLFGIRSLYGGFNALAGTLPADRRCQRACLLRRLVVSWAVCYTAVTPVMIYTLWEYFSRLS